MRASRLWQAFGWIRDEVDLKVLGLRYRALVYIGFRAYIGSADCQLIEVKIA